MRYEFNLSLFLHTRSTVGPLRSLMAQLAPYLNEAEPVHGDLETLEVLVADRVVSTCTCVIHSLLKYSLIALYPAQGVHDDDDMYVLFKGSNFYGRHSPNDLIFTRSRID